ncbi:flavin mononucleotide-binding protein [Seonamhaeicola sediminis]|uniref:Flavin mononucleotide-binding protein n=1 Tax=Seonamhaeicola sediminis TaxID=2528206 RepID=A0A562YEF8_9FLAO|nr:pyridoxamine 5'-phosphate oxidase family protein [Seonamhaeicola sediminis]TWO32909.1 flavin mononucleotide-binding protein [Seonamhaeicola sediminis]
MKDLNKFESSCVLKNNYIGYLSYISNGSPYVVPITYYYYEEGNCLISYSGEGHKIDAMRSNDLVSFCVTEIDNVNKWDSVMVQGQFKELEGTYAKQQLHKFVLGVKKLIFKESNKHPDLISDFSSKVTSGAPIIYAINVLGITGKSREY